MMYFSNGDFKFSVDDTVMLLDTNLNNNDWQIFKADNIEPGMHTFTWVYSKWNEEGQSVFQTAEIEYIKITGINYAAKECLKCKQGWS